MNYSLLRLLRPNKQPLSQASLTSGGEIVTVHVES